VRDAKKIAIGEPEKRGSNPGLPSLPQNRQRAQNTNSAPVRAAPAAPPPLQLSEENTTRPNASCGQEQTEPTLRSQATPISRQGIARRSARQPGHQQQQGDPRFLARFLPEQWALRL